MIDHTNKQVLILERVITDKRNLSRVSKLYYNN